MGNTNIVGLLLQHSADPNAQTMHNETSLHLASRAGRIEAVKLLLRNGAMIDAKARVSSLRYPGLRVAYKNYGKSSQLKLFIIDSIKKSGVMHQ